MKRNEVLEAAKEKGIVEVDGKPIHTAKTQLILEAIQSLGVEAQKEEVQQEEEVKVPTMNEQIKELGRKGLNKKEIEKEMLSRGYDGKNQLPLIRYGYIALCLKKANIVVPSAKKKVEKVEEVAEVQG